MLQTEAELSTVLENGFLREQVRNGDWSRAAELESRSLSRSGRLESESISSTPTPRGAYRLDVVFDLPSLL